MSNNLLSERPSCETSTLWVEFWNILKIYWNGAFKLYSRCRALTMLLYCILFHYTLHCTPILEVSWITSLGLTPSLFYKYAYPRFATRRHITYTCCWSQQGKPYLLQWPHTLCLTYNSKCALHCCYIIVLQRYVRDTGWVGLWSDDYVHCCLNFDLLVLINGVSYISSVQRICHITMNSQQMSVI